MAASSLEATVGPDMSSESTLNIWRVLLRENLRIVQEMDLPQKDKILGGKAQRILKL